MEQDDTMEKADENTDSYVSCYPNTRRYSLANAMATNRPRLDNQGYSVDIGGGDDEEKSHKGKRDTKIDIPMPPQYSAMHDKMADKKVKVCNLPPDFQINIFFGDFRC